MGESTFLEATHRKIKGVGTDVAKMFVLQQKYDMVCIEQLCLKLQKLKVYVWEGIFRLKERGKIKVRDNFVRNKLTASSAALL